MVPSHCAVRLQAYQPYSNDVHHSGQMLAALLKWPQATFASKLEIDQATNKARVTREVGGLDSNGSAVIDFPI